MVKKALVLLNMGGPNNLHEVELFLTNMFNDENILSIPSRGVRKFVAGLITTLRAEKAQEVYRKIGGKSPIVDYTHLLCEALQKQLGETFIVLPAMRYTPPFATNAIEQLKEFTIDHIYLFPMYPHYSTTTTKSSVEDFLKNLSRAHMDITTTVFAHYYKDSHYNQAIIDSIKSSLEDVPSKSIDLIFSAHGLPQKVIDRGDLYQRHIEEHVELLKKLLLEAGIQFQSVNLAYQSKVGPMKWLEPSLEQTLEALKNNKHVLIYPIAFTIDNSETEYELAMEYKETAHELGYVYYNVVPALNAHPRFVDAIINIVKG